MANYEQKVRDLEREVKKCEDKLSDKKRELDRSSQRLHDIEREHTKIHDDVTLLTNDLAKTQSELNVAMRERDSEKERK